jgi:hypothetical protein
MATHRPEQSALSSAFMVKNVFGFGLGSHLAVPIVTEHGRASKNKY